VNTWKPPVRVGRIHRYLGQPGQLAGVVVPRRDRVITHPYCVAQVVDALADSLDIPHLVGDLGFPWGASAMP
jgi:hypothetical protein